MAAAQRETTTPDVRLDLRRLLRPATTKILLVVIDGLGGFADAEHGTELEDARTPNLDALARDGVVGLVEPVGPGITPGSGPGHLALFGYDPLTFRLARGVLTAAGIGVELRPGDVAARGNLCTLDKHGIVTDRRAGRIRDKDARRLVERLRHALASAGQLEVELHHVREHRVLLVLRGDNLDPRVTDTDPHGTGSRPRTLEPLAAEAEATARLAARVSDTARDALAGERANGLLIRGFEGRRVLPTFSDRYGLTPAAIAGYPMYRGIARLVGMDVLRAPGSLDEACTVLEEAWDDHDFFFFHDKAADVAGENGDRAAKIEAIEAIDAVVPRLLERRPDVVAVSGDHSTPAQLAAHSWHAVPALAWNGHERDEQERFGERWCRRGTLGTRPSVDLMPVLLAMAGRLSKFGA